MHTKNAELLQERGQRCVGNKEPKSGKDAKASRGSKHPMRMEERGNLSNPVAGREHGELQSMQQTLTGEAEKGICYYKTLGGAGEGDTSDMDLEDLVTEDANVPPSLGDQRQEILTEALKLVRLIAEYDGEAPLQRGAQEAKAISQQLQKIKGKVMLTREGRALQHEEIMEWIQQRPSGTADFMAQNLSMNFRNPRSQCFANAVLRCWCWLPVYAPLSSRGCWGTTHDAMVNFLTSQDPIDIQEEPALELLWNWYPLSVQADAADFLYSLWNISQSSWLGGRWWRVTDYGALEKKHSIPLEIRYMEEDGAYMTLQQLVTNWSNEDDGQYLDAREAAVVLQLGRYKKDGVGFTKHQLPVDMQTSISIPVSYDGLEVFQTYFRVAAVVMHHGKRHEKGHFTTVLYYQDVMWHADDGDTPQPVGELTQKQKGEIFQIWLVQEAEAQVNQNIKRKPKQSQNDDVPKRYKRSGVSVAALNVTNMGKEVDKWINTQPRMPLFILETHLEGQALEKKVQKLTVSGWKVYAMEANKSQKGGTNGGIALVHPPHLQMHVIKEYNREGCGWLAVQWEMHECKLILIGIYAKCGEGVQGPVNSEIWGTLIAFVRHLQQPYMVIGDMNVEPDEFAATTIAAQMEGVVVANGVETTLHGAELDCAIIARSLQPLTVAEVDWNVPCRPHALVRI